MINELSMLHMFCHNAYLFLIKQTVFRII